jgi:hypothetical protein
MKAQERLMDHSPKLAVNSENADRNGAHRKSISSGWPCHPSGRDVSRFTPYDCYPRCELHGKTFSTQELPQANEYLASSAACSRIAI